MNKDEQVDFLIQTLINEGPRRNDPGIPGDYEEKRKLLRSLMNLRPPLPIAPDFLKIQDHLLTAEVADRGITDLQTLPAILSDPRLTLWLGDMTALKIDAIVNAANDRLLGCFVPCHRCIDNAIHSMAGVQLRLECHEIMQKQGFPEPTGKAKITRAYNLPCSYILHTVGPIINGPLTSKDCQLLASCYLSCLELAAENQISSVAFCSISTGEFHFPQEKAAEIAVQTVRRFVDRHSQIKRVVFNVFKEEDYRIYRELLGPDQSR